MNKDTSGELDPDIVHRYKHNIAFYKKLSTGTEATAIFVGNHSSVLKPVAAIVRLKNAKLLQSIVEVQSIDQ